MTTTPDIEVLLSDYCSFTTFCSLTEKGKETIKDAKAEFYALLCDTPGTRYGLTPHDIVIPKHYEADLWNWLAARACVSFSQLEYCYDENGELLAAFAA
jgi:hypothetical protein